VSQENKPSKESLREVKREYKQRQKDEKARKKAADKYWAEQTNPGGSSGPRIKVTSVGKIIVAVSAFSAVFWGVGMYQNLAHSTSAQATAADPTSSPSSSNTMPPSPSPTPKPLPGNTDPLPVIPLSLDPSIPKLQLGDAGLVAPAAKPVGGFSNEQVADAYRRTVGYLRTATLDKSVVFRGKIQPVLDHFGAETVQYALDQHRLSQSSKGKDGLTWAEIANRFRPGDWTSLTSPQHTAEGMKLAAKKGSFHGTLDVNFTVETAYQLRRVSDKASVTMYVIRKGTLNFAPSDSASVTKPNLLRFAVTFMHFNEKHMDCGVWVDIDYLEIC